MENEIAEMLDDIGVTDAPSEPEEQADENAETAVPENPNETSDEEFENLINSIEAEQGVAPSSDDVKQIDVTDGQEIEQGIWVGTRLLKYLKIFFHPC